MDDSIEADLRAAHLAPFARDEGGWTDAYVTSMSQIDPKLEPFRVRVAAITAWRLHGWVHPAVVAHLEFAQRALSVD